MLGLGEKYIKETSRISREIEARPSLITAFLSNPNFTNPYFAQITLPFIDLVQVALNRDGKLTNFYNASMLIADELTYELIILLRMMFSKNTKEKNYLALHKELLRLINFEAKSRALFGACARHFSTVTTITEVRKERET